MQLFDSTLQKAGEFLSEIPQLRFEWSLEVTAHSAEPRSVLSIWIGRTGQALLASHKSQIEALLRCFYCPKCVFDAYMRKVPNLAYIGITIAWKHQILYFSLLMHTINKLNALEERLCYRWSHLQPNRVKSLEKIHYDFFSFSNADWVKLNGLLTDASMKLLEHLLQSENKDHLGFWVKIEKQKITEVYLTIPWLPIVRLIQAPSTEKALEPYQHCHFRHIGFPVKASNKAGFTIYFSAPRICAWPQDAKSFQSQVLTSASDLHLQLNAYLNQSG